MNLNGFCQDGPQLSAHFRQIPRGSESIARDRSADADNDLEIAFSRIRQEVRLGSRMVFRMVIRGKSRALAPIIRDEAYRIGREALVNAFLHSGAARVEVDLEYAPKQLRISVRDDGKGITPELLRSECSHQGLTEIRDLAQRMGAKLKLLSRVEAGTEVELSIPAHIAFASEANHRQLECAGA